MKALLVAILVSGSFVYGAIDKELDAAATKLQEVTEHFLETIHEDAKLVGPAIKHLDTDVHELSEAAEHFHEEVHHDHGHAFNVKEFAKVQSVYFHTSETFHKKDDFAKWTKHMRSDMKLVRGAFYAVDTELFWSDLEPGGHGHRH